MERPTYEQEMAAYTARFKAEKEKALQFITYAHDGPVTRHVMLCRAMDLARKGGFPRVEGPLGHSADPIAEALDDALGQEWEHSGA
jgi:hypothetical protein